MDGITDAPMRSLMGEVGAFSYAVSEFVRVSISTIPAKVFRRDVPELETAGVTDSGLPVQVQILGGDAERMAASAINAVKAGARAIDINFGCPAPTVNRNDGGASLLRTPCRIREVVAAVRAVTPPWIPVSAKLRLGWDSIEDIHVNAEMAAEGGASWLTIHARTRTQGYQPPVYWPQVGLVKARLGLPVVANGDIWTFEDFLRCREETGCRHFMIGRGALANPVLSHQIARELGIGGQTQPETDWAVLFSAFLDRLGGEDRPNDRRIARLKQWMKLASRHGEFKDFEMLKEVTTAEELLGRLRTPTRVG